MDYVTSCGVHCCDVVVVCNFAHGGDGHVNLSVLKTVVLWLPSFVRKGDLHFELAALDGASVGRRESSLRLRARRWSRRGPREMLFVVGRMRGRP